MPSEVRAHPFDPWQELSTHQTRLKGGAFGACAVFVGSMRDFNHSEPVTAMTIEHYAGMTERQLTKLVADAIAQHDLLDALLLHRVGELHPNDPIVLVATWSAHRAPAFTACREIMETLKTHATFWKKETLPTGDRWVDANTPEQCGEI